MYSEIEHALYGILVEIHDITDHVNFNNMRNQLISFISHELRNPLSTINLSLETYKEFGKSLSRQKIDELMGYIDQNVSIMKKIVKDFDLFAKTELEKIELTYDHYDIIETLKEAIAQLKPKLEKKNITLKTKFPETDISICCDKDRINQIFRILLDNSLKYSEKDSTIEVEIIENYKGKFNPKDEQGYLIKIKDSGIGIKQEDLVNIFEPFYRGQNTRTEKGSGLGLTLAKRLISLHRGDIYIESEYQKGTTSLVFIPLNTQKCLKSET
jgi:two-component system sensor histidine kinase VicK